MAPASISGGLPVAGLTLDIAVNAAQDWFCTIYGDARWSHRVKHSPALCDPALGDPALGDLAREEARIDRILQSDAPDPEAPHR